VQYSRPYEENIMYIENIFITRQVLSSTWYLLSWKITVLTKFVLKIEIQLCTVSIRVLITYRNVKQLRHRMSSVSHQIIWVH